MSTERAVPLANGPTGGQAWQIKRLPLSKLTPAGYNPRLISDAARKGLTASIERFGLVQPIVYNKRTGNIVGGHQRLDVLLARGDTEADVVVVDLPEEEEKALNLTLNNPAIQGEFTTDVTALLDELQEALPEVCLDLQLARISELDLTPTEAVLPEFREYDESVAGEVKYATCPECAHKFPI